MIDYWLVYRFLKLMATSFSEWPAFKEGVIDKDGKILVPKAKRSLKQKDSFSVFDILVRNLKMIVEKIPGGKTSLAKYAVALYLIKEHNMFKQGDVLNESMEHVSISEEKLARYINEEINTTAEISSLYSNAVSKSAQRRYTKRNKEDSDEDDEISVHSDDPKSKRTK